MLIISFIWLFLCVIIECILAPYIGFSFLISFLMMFSNLIIVSISNNKKMAYILFLFPLLILLLCYLTKAPPDELRWSIIKWLPCCFLSIFQRYEKQNILPKYVVFYYFISLIPFMIIVYDAIAAPS